MKTVIRRVLLMSALMSPGALYALGLGEIKLNSALNQPFDADIELISATQEDLSALRAALAPSDTFARYGLDRPAYLSDFTFRVAKGTGGRDVLRVTSPRPVTEPFVTLLVEANWPRGRLLREYTVLLDPPVFAPASSAPAPAVAAPRVSSGGATSSRATETTTTDAGAAPAGSPGVEAPAPAPAPRPAPEPRAAAATRAIEPGSSYRVRPNDTLWNIASAAHPGRRSDINRAMVAIYQQNPSAFDGNINILRSGSTLRIPESGQVQAISASAAAAEVARQYDAWRNGAATPASGAAEDSARLRLVPPEQGTAAPSTAVASTPAPAAAGTPSATSGTAATTPADADIEERIRRLEGELAEAKRLLEVRNAELASMQGQSAAATAEPPAASPGATPEAAAPAADAAATAPTAPPAPEAAPAPAPTAPPAAAPPAEPEGPSLFERLRAFWWVPLALLAAALAAYLFRRMRRERGEAEENLEAALSQRDLRAPATATPTYTPRSRENAIVVEEKRPADTRAPVAPAAVAAAVAATAAPAPSRKPVLIDDTLSGEAPASLESGDPLAEADFHMAYGLYDQAADLVELAIKREPQRRDLKLKLLEIFFVWGNRNRFLDVARDLDATRSEAPAGEWDKVLIMGKQIAPDDRLFGGTPSTSPESLDMELHGATAALDLDVGGATSIRAVTDLDLTEKTARVDSSGLDFVFDESTPGLDSASASPTVETPRPADAGSVAPTIETPRVKIESAGDTQELTVDRLGLDVEAVRSLEALDSDDSLSIPRPVKVEDTVETPTAPRGGRSLLDEERDGTDLLNSTALMRMVEDTPLAEAAEGDEAVVDLSDVTGELPGLDFPVAESGIKPTARNYDSFEQPTQSEVGTKLDLARAYMDMGDPEGARSILEEVLQEGNPTQQQEARRLISSLPA